jgi:hypothetical protein
MQFASAIAERLPRRLDDIDAVLKPSSVSLARVRLLVAERVLDGGYLADDENDGPHPGEVIIQEAPIGWEFSYNPLISQGARPPRAEISRFAECDT